MPRASSLAAELVESFGAEVTLLAGAGGVFEINVEGTLLFSKNEVGRFPEEGEIVTLIQAL